jgi:hypothetical protein
VATQFRSIVQAKVAAGMRASQAIECALRECPNAKYLSAAEMIDAQSAAERDADTLQRSPGADGGMTSPLNVPSNGSGQRGLGVTSNPSRSM